jgi:hypothetical protein
MKYNPLTEQQMQEAKQPLKKGEAFFRINYATEKISKAGNEMLEISLSLRDLAGNTGDLKDYLPNSNKSLWKIKSLLAAIDKSNLYELGEITEQTLKGCYGKCIIEEKEDSKYFQIKEYLPFSKENESQFYTKDRQDAEIADMDDIPF